MTKGLYASRHGGGAFVRDVTFHADADVVRASLEDDMHHFVVELRHDGSHITAATGWPVRWPWTTCLESTAQLAALVGQPLQPAPVTVGPHIDVRDQCTHQFDVAVWAIGHAHRFVHGGAAARRYTAVIPDFDAPPFTVRLYRDRVLVLELESDTDRALGPDRWTGVVWRGRFIDWVRDNLDADDAEAALIVRRAVWLAPARHIDLEICAHLGESGLTTGACFASAPQRIELAARNKGSLRDRAHRASTITP